jgi:hypothetical protein
VHVIDIAGGKKDRQKGRKRLKNGDCRSVFDNSAEIVENVTQW